MPNLNRKGPNGEGAMTGKKKGKCNPENKGKTDENILQERILSSQPNRGVGSGPGLGRGKRLGQRFKKNG